MNRIMKRVALPIGAAAALGTTGFAFMATNAVAPSAAGEGSGAITGYNVSKISYTGCKTMNPFTVNGDVCSVTFRLNPSDPNTQEPANSGTNVQVAFNHSESWFACRYEGAPGSNAGTQWACDFPRQDTAGLTSIQVMAAQ